MSKIEAVSWRSGRNFGKWHFVRATDQNFTLCGAFISGPLARISRRPIVVGDPQCRRCAAVHHHEMMKTLEVNR
jgi:hypothetical protein